MIAIAILAALAAEATTDAASSRGEARTVIEAQLASPPRTDGTGGVDAREAEAIRRRAIEMIGKSILEEGTSGSR